MKQIEHKLQSFQDDDGTVLVDLLFEKHSMTIRFDETGVRILATNGITKKQYELPLQHRG